jgi:carbonic anhydrase/acetyltransferase-like protein (isoleucine patch superfamily)
MMSKAHPVCGYITSFNGHTPRIEPTAFVDVSARLIGRVTIAAGVSVWPGAVLRADDEEIRIGQGSAVLDMCLLEAPAGRPVVVEPGALVSHMVCLHGAVVKTGSLVGIGAIVLDGSVVGERSIVGAGSLVPPGMEVPSGVLVMGQPAKVIRELKPAERETVGRQLAELKAKAEVYRRG